MKERNAGIRSLDGDFAYTTLPRRMECGENNKSDGRLDIEKEELKGD